MAGPGDPFTPGPTVDPTAGIPNMQDFESLRNQWATFLDQPGARTALLQFGTTLLQTPGFGETPAGQIGRAIGAGGEAVTRQQEAESKQELRGAQTEAATQRALGAASTLGLGYYRQQAMNERQKNALMLRAQAIYSSDIKAMQARYDAAKLTGNPPPLRIPSFDEWMRYRGIDALRLGVQGPGTTSSAPPTEEPTAPAETE